MSGIRQLWDRLTGREAERAYDEQEHRWTAEVRRLRDQHRDEIQQIQHVARDAGVDLYRDVDWIDVSTLDHPGWKAPGTYQWAARPYGRVYSPPDPDDTRETVWWVPPMEESDDADGEETA